MFSAGRTGEKMIGVKGKEKQAQCIDFHCVSLEAEVCLSVKSDGPISCLGRAC